MNPDEQVPDPQGTPFAQLPPDRQAKIRANLAIMQGKNAPDQDIESYLRDVEHVMPVGQTVPVQPGQHDYHAEFASGALAKRMAGANARDVANAAEPTEVPTSTGAMANVIHRLPVIGAAQAGVRALLRGQSYPDAYNDIQGASDALPASSRVLGEVSGAIPLMAMLPGSAATSGAIYGGAEQALSGDPERGLGARIARGAAGAAGGALLGKGSEMALTGLRAALPVAMGGTPNTAANLVGRAADRARSAAALYKAALAQGQGQAATPQIQQYLAEPDIADIVSGLQGTRRFANVAPESPEMLDAIYKTLSDRAGTVKRGLESITPNKPNIGRFLGQDIAAAKTQGLNAMDETMPLYRDAVEDYTSKSADMNALGKGSDALRAKLAGNLPSAKNMTRTTPEAFEDWMTKNPALGDAASEGILGTTKMAMGKGFGSGRRAVSEAPSLLRLAGNGNQAVLDALTKAGLLTANTQAPQ